MKNLFFSIMRPALCTLGLFLNIPNAAAQIDEQAVTGNFIRQLYLFPQEKIHIHIDRHNYLPEERIWIKAYLVDAALHTSFSESRYVYLELLDPLENVISRIKIRKEDDVFCGYIDLADDLAEGEYILRAYTSYMRNLDQGYWPHVPVYINDPGTAMIEFNPRIEYTSPGKAVLDLTVTDRISKAGNAPKTVSVKYNKNVADTEDIKDGAARFRLSVDTKEKTHIVLAEYGNCRKYLPLPAPPEDYEVAFFPEGGNLLSGTINRVAFKAIDSEGRSLKAAGRIVDETGAVITDFETVHEGMGAFFIKPEKDKKYYASVSGNTDRAGRRFELPPVVETLGLKANDAGDEFHVSVIASPGVAAPDSLYVMMHVRGMRLYMSQWSGNTISLAKDRFPSGVLHILLFDSGGLVYSERLMFCNNGYDQALVEATLPSGAQVRQLVSVGLQISDKAGNPLEANMSVSVTDARMGADDNETILSSLLLTSALKGYIANPDYYFGQATPGARAALDLLMLTHGWRRYNIPDVIRGVFSEPGPAPLELGQEISGSVTNFMGNKPIREAQVDIISPYTGYFDNTATDNNGRFRFRHFELPDSTGYVVSVRARSGFERIELMLDEDAFPPVNVTIPLPAAVEDDNEAITKFVLEEGVRTIHLDPVEVRTSTLAPQTVYSIMAEKTYSQDDFKEKNMGRITDVFRTIPGFVETNGIVYSVKAASIYAKPKPIAIFIDGVYVEQDDAFANTRIDDLVPIDNVENIFVYKTEGSTVFLGPRAAGGAIMIITKKGMSSESEQPVYMYNMKYVSPLSYQKPVEFYSPRYDTEQSRRDKTPDKRLTVYWNPALRSSKDGKAAFDFYTADSPAYYIVIVEGLSAEGKIVRYAGELKITE